MLIKTPFLAVSAILLFAASGSASATQADDTIITVVAQDPGTTPFFTQLTLSASDTTVLKSIQFAIAPKPASVTRPFSVTYSSGYLISRGYLQPPSGDIFLPVYGLYDGYANTVTLTYDFLDGSSKHANITVTTTIFADPCGYNHPTVLKARTKSTDLSYDYILIKGLCAGFSPAIIDTDGALRWMSATSTYLESETNAFFDNAIYYASKAQLYRIDLDGAFTLLTDYAPNGVTGFHHNIDRGKTGLLLEANTTSYFESTIMEVDAAGAPLKTWNMADIISEAMTAGGDDPSQFVYPAPADWFHNNSVAYNRADDSLIISSRENFLICLDYETSAIKWIFGDTTKKWYQFPSLRQYAIAAAPGSLVPIGQHAISITYDQNIMVFDNGYPSSFQQPAGEGRSYASPRKYRLDLTTKVATEVWNYEMNQSVACPVCGSVYEDAPLNYLVDYSYAGGFAAEQQYAQLTGLNASGEQIFYYQYPTVYCVKAFNSIPIHLENMKFPAVGPRALNLSTRGAISGGDNALIGGFIVTGTDSKKVVLRALGPSLGNSGLTGALADPVLTLYNSSGAVIATNDDWQTDPSAGEITAAGLAPTEGTEAASVQTLAPAAYTVVVTGKDSTPGIGLVEAYDLSPALASKLANISTRGFVGTGDNVLISGFIVGDVANASLIIRALGPSLASATVSQPLADPTLTIYDQHGAMVATNDNWHDDANEIDIQKNGLAPTNTAESATALFLPAGAYSAIAKAAGDNTGIGLVEVYDLD